MKKLIAVGILSVAMAVAEVTMTQRAALAYSTTNCYQDMLGVHCQTQNWPTYNYGYQNPYMPTFQRTNCYRDMLGVHCTTY
jgi:hypothetical protein